MNSLDSFIDFLVARTGSSTDRIDILMNVQAQLNRAMVMSLTEEHVIDLRDLLTIYPEAEILREFFLTNVPRYQEIITRTLSDIAHAIQRNESSTPPHIDLVDHRAVEAQAAFARRRGEVIELPNDDETGFDRWRIVDVALHDDHAPVMLQEENGGRTRSLPALRLARFELAARNHASHISAGSIISIDDIPSLQTHEETETDPLEQTLTALRRWERYAPAGVIPSAFPEEVALAATAALVQL